MVRSNNDCEREGCAENSEIGARSAPQLDKGMPFRHAHRDSEKNGAERGEWNVAGERRRQEYDRY